MSCHSLPIAGKASYSMGSGDQVCKGKKRCCVTEQDYSPRGRSSPVKPCYKAYFGASASFSQPLLQFPPCAIWPVLSDLQCLGKRHSEPGNHSRHEAMWRVSGETESSHNISKIRSDSVKTSHMWEFFFAADWRCCLSEERPCRMGTMPCCWCTRWKCSSDSSGSVEGTAVFSVTHPPHRRCKSSWLGWYYYAVKQGAFLLTAKELNWYYTTALSFFPVPTQFSCLSY